MNRRTVAAMAAATLIMMSGCSPTEPTPESEPPSTVGQFASVVARHDTPIRKTVDDNRLCYVDMIVDDSGIKRDRCVEAAAEGRSSVIELGNGLGELGEPPVEIDELVQRMIRAGEGLVDNGDLDVRTQCDPADNDDCATTVGSIMGILDEVIIPELDAWSPYL